MIMAWFRNFYQCENCDAKWEGEWSCMVDEECPICADRDVTPYDADELTFLVDRWSGVYTVLRSQTTAEDTPDYVEIAQFPTRELADSFVLEVEEKGYCPQRRPQRPTFSVQQAKASPHPCVSCHAFEPAMEVRQRRCTTLPILPRLAGTRLVPTCQDHPFHAQYGTDRWSGCIGALVDHRRR
jgi:hypothetical protein